MSILLRFRLVSFLVSIAVVSFRFVFNVIYDYSHACAFGFRVRISLRLFHIYMFSFRFVSFRFCIYEVCSFSFRFVSKLIVFVSFLFQIECFRFSFFVSFPGIPVNLKPP